MPPERLSQMGGISPITGDPPARWLCEWIPDPSRTDNLRKLGRVRASPFRPASRLQSRPFAVNDLLIPPKAPLPAMLLTLPSEITHVWTMSPH
jgi:hypothetical protein